MFSLGIFWCFFSYLIPFICFVVCFVSFDVFSHLSVPGLDVVWIVCLQRYVLYVKLCIVLYLVTYYLLKQLRLLHSFLKTY